MEEILKMSLKERDRLYEVKKVIEEGIGTIKEPRFCTPLGKLLAKFPTFQQHLLLIIFF